MYVHVKVVAGTTSILAEETFFVSFVHCAAEFICLFPEFSTNVDVSSFGSHSEADYESSLNEFMRVVAKDFTILARAWL